MVELIDVAAVYWFGVKLLLSAAFSLRYLTDANAGLLSAYRKRFCD